MKKTAFILGLIIGLAISVYSQTPAPPAKDKLNDTTLVNDLLQKSKEALNESPEKAIALAEQAKDLADDIDFKKGKALAQKSIGLGYYYQNKYIEALDNWNKSLKNFEKLNDQVGIANLLNNIGAVY